MKSQEIVSKYPKIIKEWKKGDWVPTAGEWHVGGYNFNGANTEISNRLSLDYKGQIGSNSSFLPVNKLDYNAFQHDLLYFVPDDITRAYADSVYLKKLKQMPYGDIRILSELTMAGIYASRLGRLGLGVITNTVSVIVGSKQLRKSLTSLYKYLTHDDRIFNHESFTMMNVKFAEVMNSYIRERLKKRQQIKYSHLHDFASIVTAGTLLYGSSFFTKPFKNAEKMFGLFETNYKLNKKWVELEKENDKVMKSYDEYLDEVGKFKNDDFKIRTDINTVEAEKKYKQFFEKYQDYLRFVNKAYIDFEGFKQIKIPELNQTKLKEVAFPRIQVPPEITITKRRKDEINDIMKNITKTEPSEILDEINNVLAGIQDEPFMSKREEEKKEGTDGFDWDDEEIDADELEDEIGQITKIDINAYGYVAENDEFQWDGFDWDNESVDADELEDEIKNFIG